MRLVWAALCDKAIIDGVTRKLSLIDISEILIVSEVASSKLPTAIRTDVTFAAAFWYGSGDNEPEIEARLTVVGPKKERQHVFVTTVGEPEKKSNSSTRLVVNLSQLPYWGLGSYEVELEVRSVGSKKWKRAASYPFLIQPMPKSDSTSPEPPSAPILGALPESS